jgi:DNA-directed RNA polymerase specialized sigma24 family protein
MGYVTDQKSQIHSEFGLMMPRLRSFALSLTGCEVKAQTLVRATRHHLLARSAKERGHMPLALWALMQMQKIWASRMKGRQADQVDPRLFQPRSRAQDVAAARFAMRLARLSPFQRGALHLVYGERLSYDEVADIFEVEVSEIIGWLTRSYAALGEMSARERSRPNTEGAAVRSPEAAAKRQGRAA